jgi:hypothetical protein
MAPNTSYIETYFLNYSTQTTANYGVDEDDSTASSFSSTNYWSIGIDVDTRREESKPKFVIPVLKHDYKCKCLVCRKRNKLLMSFEKGKERTLNREWKRVQKRGKKLGKELYSSVNRDWKHKRLHIYERTN